MTCRITLTNLLIVVAGFAFSTLSPRMAQAASGTLVLNEIQTAGVGDAAQEFIEIYNITGNDIGLEGMSLSYMSAQGSTGTTVYRFGAGTYIPSHGYYLLVHSDRSVGGSADAYFNAGLAAGGGGLAILGTENQIVDSVGWGTAVNSYVEGSAAGAPDSGSSLGRISFTDTDQNLEDFIIQPTPNPRGTGDSVPVPLPMPILTLGISLLVIAGMRKGKCRS